jgi:spore coat protein U-like protein
MMEPGQLVVLSRRRADKVVMKHIRLVSMAFGALSMIASPLALSQTATDSMQVSITIANNCSISANDLDFGSYSSLASDIDVDSGITVNCSSGTNYTVSLDLGVYGDRLLTDGSNKVDYELYTSPQRDVAWGTNVGVDTVGGTGDGNDQGLTVYGRVPSQGTPPVSTYTDFVTATVAF